MNQNFSKIFYWAPFIDQIATIRAVINSAHSLKKFSKNKTPYIIDVFGEWLPYYEEINDKKINIITLYKYNLKKFFPKGGFIKSRLSYILIFLINFYSLITLIKKEKPQILIAHLITSLPIILTSIINPETKIILRISGYPRLNIFRVFFWKIFSQKIYKITTPTKETYDLLVNSNIFDLKKISILNDPIIDIDLIKKRKEIPILNTSIFKKKYILSVGRFTKQKNHELLINFFFRISQLFDDIFLVIIGSKGECQKKIEEMIFKLKLNNKITIMNYQNNIFNYIKNANCIISTSLWEDPGFVMVEAAACNTAIISSDCPSGPKEFLNNGKNGYLFKNNDVNDLLNKYLSFKNEDINTISKKKILAKLNSKNYTKLRHFKNLEKII
jgi:glycosyltransferase involved in cell wall biosynthesis